MRQLSELETTLNHFLDWSKPRISFLIQILQALFLVRTVNLTQVAQKTGNRGILQDFVSEWWVVSAWNPEVRYSSRKQTD